MQEFAKQQNRVQDSHITNPLRPDRMAPQAVHHTSPVSIRQQLPGNQASQLFARSCPLSLPGPGLCPFGGVCHTCPVPVQAKLTVNKPGDKYEQEADRVADIVMKMPEPQVQRQVAPDEEEEETLQTKPLADQITPIVQRQVVPEEEEEEE